MLCAMGWNSCDSLLSPGRLKTPLVRKNGALTESTWEEALDLVCSRLVETRDKSGPDALGFLCSGRCTNEENYLLMKLARAVFRTNNVDNCDRLRHSSTTAGLAAAFGSGAMTNSIGEFDDADLFFVIGSNTTAQHPLIGTRIVNAVDRGARFLLFDPRETPFAPLATIHLRHNLGTEVALVNGVMNIIIQEDLHDRVYIESRTEGFDGLKAVLGRYTPKVVEQITGVRSADLYRAAVMYAQADKAMIVCSTGMTQHAAKADNLKTLMDLAMMTGHVGRHSTGVNPLMDKNNSLGACDMGALPEVFTGYQEVKDPETLKRFEDRWGVTGLTDRPGLTFSGMVEAAHAGSLKCLYVMGENPLPDGQDPTRVEHALANLEFLVVQDIFLTATAALADVVLPAASFAEKDGTYTSTERRVQLARKALDPPGAARPDWEIIAELLPRLGLSCQYKDTEQVFTEICSTTPSYAGITYPRLAGGHGLQWPCPTEEHPGTAFLHRDRFTRDRGRFLPCDFMPSAEDPYEEYDLILTTRRHDQRYSTGVMPRGIDTFGQEPPPALEINPEDARRYGIRNNDMVEVESRSTSIRLRAEVNPRVPRRVIFTDLHFRESPLHRPTITSSFDPAFDNPELKGCAVKIRRCS
jgi:formate dehydrogenase alpha subunit